MSRALTALLVVVGMTVLPVRPAGQAADFPKLVVPALPDLTIKTRRTFDPPNSTTDTEIVYVKGAWQRREQILDFPPMPSAPPTNRNIRITRCDERRTLELNDRARTYASWPIED